MVERSLGEATAAMSGRLVAGDPAARFAGVAIDSRRTVDGNLFFALAGARTHGHRFAADALKRGAAAAVVEQAPEMAAGSGAFVRVANTLEALHDLTRHVRRTVPRQLVAITGSVGKTTTKELLAAMLAGSFRTAKSPGNLNNLYGFPISLLGIDDDCAWMVAEMGMSTPGELRAISLLGRPDVALLTNVRPAHLENFAHLDAIAEAKAELLAGLPAHGLVVANGDDERVLRIAQRHPGRVVRFSVAGRGACAEPDLVLENLRPRPNGVTGTTFTLKSAEHQAVEVSLPLHGAYNAENALAAATCAHALGVSLEDIARRLRDVRPAAMRGIVAHLAQDVTLIDDTYNANPSAVERALEGLLALPAARHVAVLGDMLELGAESEVFHRQAGRTAAQLGSDLVVGVGARARALVAAAAAEGSDNLWFADAQAAAAWVRSPTGPQPGDAVLVKGSRGVGLEVVTAALQQRFAPMPADGEGE